MTTVIHRCGKPKKNIGDKSWSEPFLIIRNGRKLERYGTLKPLDTIRIALFGLLKPAEILNFQGENCSHNGLVAGSSPAWPTSLEQ